MGARRFLIALTTTVAVALPGAGPSTASVGPVANPATYVGPLAAAGQAGNAVRKPRRPAVIAHRVIGRSVQDRPIHAYRLGNRKAKRSAVVLSTMHGNERETRHILRALRDGAKVRGIDLWLIPTYNPDGWLRGTRKNAHGVDLNRNFPYSWRHLDGNYESGPRAGSEPETRAMMRFLRRVRPKWVVSFHQPLHGVDMDTKNKALARRLARQLRLPHKDFTCGGVCHGTMTGWYNHHFAGSALTVEYGARPTMEQMMRRAPRQLLRALRARR